MVTARASGVRVEDTSQRDEFTRVYANPDGTWTAETASEPESVQDENDIWHYIDPTLLEDDGRLAPKYGLSDVTISAGGDRVFATMSEDGKDLAFKWPTVLPEPVVDGASATYPGVAAGGVGDLVVTANNSGFSYNVVLHEEPTAPVEVAVPVVTDGGVLKETDDGGLQVTKKDGDPVVAAPEPVMFDASTNEDGDPTNVVTVDAEVGESAAGTPVLTLLPADEFLHDPETVYPVTVDPTWDGISYTDDPLYGTDTWVQTPDFPNAQTSSEELRVGSKDAGTHQARAFMHFPGAPAPWDGKTVDSAALVLRNFDSGSCTSGNVRASMITQVWSGGTLSWGNQPAVSASYDYDYAPAKGPASCPAGDASWDVTAMVRQWTNGTNNNGIRLSAVTATASNTYRRYRSANYQNYPSLRPHLNITWHSLPGTAAIPDVSPSLAYTPSEREPDVYYTPSATPTFSSTVTDADGGFGGIMFRVYFGSSMSWYTQCSASYANPGDAAQCAIPNALGDGSYTVRAKAGDYWNWAGGSLDAEEGWSQRMPFIVDTTPPATPSVVADHAVEGAWGETRPPSNTFHFTSSSADTASFTYKMDGVNPQSRGADIGWNPSSGSHTLSVQAVDRAGNPSSGWKDFTWGVGGVAVATAAKIPTSTDNFPLSISGPPGAVSAQLQWHFGATDDPWSTVTKVKKVDGTTWDGVPTAGDAGSEVNDLIWSATSEPVPHPAPDHPDQTIEGPAMLEVRACFIYNGAPQQCSSGVSLQLVESAFGGSFPVSDAGPGQVALKTGEFATDASDASVAGGAGSSLSISRTYASDSGPHPQCVTGQSTTCDATGVFGPGWTASLDGADAGLAGMQLIDNTGLDGTLVLTSAAGDTLAFAPDTNWAVRTSADITAGGWHGVDDLTPQLGLKATVSGTGTNTRFIVTDDAGVVTTFKATAAPAASVPVTNTPAVPAVFAAETVQEPGAGSTTYNRDARGRVTRILGALPAGMSAADCPLSPDVSHPWVAGCRALEVEYATTTSATAPGDQDGQVRRISLRVYDAQNAAGAAKPLASYAYDSNRRLVAATDELTGLTTTYTYSGGRLATLKPPGLTPYQLEYSGANDRLARVKRDRPAAAGGGTATPATIIYDLRPDLLTDGLPDLRPQTVLGTWGQAVAPVYGAAVFGPDRPVTAGDRTEVGANDWPYADLWYTDSRGRTVNTATYGAGDWQLSYTAYNDLGNPVRQLDAGDIAAIKSHAITTESAGTLTVYNTNSNGPSNTPAGTVVTDVYGPPRSVRAADGTFSQQRPHTRTSYDEGAPNGGTNPATGRGWAMPTTVTTEAVKATTMDAIGNPVSVVKTTYGDTAGWTLGLPTTSTTVMGGADPDIVTRTSYDSAGRVTEQRQPKSNGTDAGTRRTVYYTKAANATYPSCGGKADWEGLTCRTDYAGAPSNGPAIPVTTVDGYDQFLLQPATNTETSGGVTRATHTTYDTAGRTKKTWTTLNGATSVPAPGSELEYDPATGLPTKQWATDTTGTRASEHIDTGYDAWGRTTTYTPYGDPATTTTYDSAGRVATVADPKGTTTYSYDVTDAAGKIEHRGLPTKLSVTAPTGNVEFSGAYDADGNLVLEKLPGSLTRRTSYDTAGQQTGLTYSGTVNHYNAQGALTSVDPDAPWLTWTMDRDIAGRVTGESTPDAAAPSGKLTAGIAAAYSRGYTYDRAGRLAKVVDRTAPAGAAQYDMNNNLTGTACQTREYAFDANGNRTSLKRSGANTDGSCSASVVSTKTSSYDTADRYDTGSGYAYDALGRVTAMPAGDTPLGASAGSIALGYYDTDDVRTIAQGGTTSTYTLDAAGRRALEASGPTAGATTTVTSHFIDSSDNPTWAEKTSAGTTTTSRYLESLDGDLSAALMGSDLSLELADPHGDTVTTVAIPTSGAATGIDAWNNYDEYGNTLTGAIGAAPLKNATGIGYGWVGEKQRATQATGLVLMGARVYNPTTETFTSMDPVYGGNATTYAYPLDPINQYDLTGLVNLAAGGGGGAGIPPAGGYRPVNITGGIGAELGGGIKKGVTKGVKKIFGGLFKKSKKVVKTQAENCSFSGSTLVLMADGSKKPIDQIQVGDLVVATDPESGEQLAKPVEAVLVHDDTVVDLVIDGDRITTTENHPFWSVTDQRFERADQLAPGEGVLGADGRVLGVVGLALKSARKALAYNLAVEGIHTYQVGHSGILVHNSCKWVPKKKGYTETTRNYKSADAAERAARADSSVGGACRYRPECGKGDHVHVDYFNKHGTISHTNRYRWTQ